MVWIGKKMFFNATGYIYFIQMDRIGPIKIGFTKDIGKRLISLQTGSPYPLRLLWLTVGNEDIEREIHSCFNSIRMEGEWFLPHPFLMKTINEITEIDKKDGFIEPIPEYDIDDPFSENSNHDKYYKYISNAEFNWKEFLTSQDFQIFKKEQDESKRERILDKYILNVE